MNIRDTFEYKELGFKVVKCPCCNNETLNNNWVCPVCGWEYDNTLNYDEYSYANKSTLNEFISKYKSNNK